MSQYSIPCNLQDMVISATGLPPKVLAFTTTRFSYSQGSMNFGLAEDTKAALKNRLYLAKALQMDITWLTQTHSTRVLELPYTEQGYPEADATMSFSPKEPCVVLTADCLPIVLASMDGKACATIHAGWRGLAKGVIESTLCSLQKKHKGTYVTWLGPAISQQYFQVGLEVKQAFTSKGFPESAFLERINAQGGRIHCADLYALAKYALQSSGIKQISGGDYCTYTDDARFFSHRRQQHNANEVYGRMATVVYTLC